MDKKLLDFLQKFKRPKGWWLVLLYVFTAIVCISSIVLAVLGLQQPILQVLSYILYGLAGVTLGYTVYTIVIYAPKIKTATVNVISKSAFGKRILNHYGFRTVIFAGVSLIINIIYVAFNVLLALYFGSIWYGSLAGYYALLIALRSGLVFYHKGKKQFSEQEQKRVELKKYKSCGIILTIVPVCLSVAIAQMVAEGKAFEHWSWTAIAFAAYAFYKIIMAIINLVKVRKQEDYTIKALRSVSLADAIVSILALQTTLLTSYGTGDFGFANALTGAVACILVFALGVFMIKKVSSKKEET